MSDGARRLCEKIVDDGDQNGHKHQKVVTNTFPNKWSIGFAGARGVARELEPGVSI